MKKAFFDNFNSSILKQSHSLLNKIAWSLILFGIIICIIFLYIMMSKGWTFWRGQEIQFDTTGQVGDFIGGIVGTIFSFSGFILLYLTLNEQKKSDRITKFESKFFEMIRLHRANIDELEYSKYDNDTDEMITLNKRKVFKEIFNEFIEAYHEVKQFHEMCDKTNFIQDTYKATLQKIITSNSIKATPLQLANIDIAYCIVYYGISKSQESVLINKFESKYDSNYVKKLIIFYQLKPKKEKKEYFKSWQSFCSLPYKAKLSDIEELFQNREIKIILPFQNVVPEIRRNLYIENYYRGHQHRLGHYYRHLFQSFKFLDNQEYLSEDEKKFYGKTYRAQLSTHEQLLLFIDSVSSIGLQWELYRNNDNFKDLNAKELKLQKQKLITGFQLIKNIPDKQIDDIKIMDFYPDIKFE